MSITPEQRDEWRERHVSSQETRGVGRHKAGRGWTPYCDYCLEDWPCPDGEAIAALLDALAAAEQRAAEKALPMGHATPATFHDPLPPGTPVLAWSFTHHRPAAGRVRNGSPLVTRTRGEVWSLYDGTRVVAVEGYTGGIALTHIDVLPGGHS